MRAVLALCCAVSCLLAPGAAWAQRVLLVRPPATDMPMSEAFNRLRAELQLQDFDVQVLDVAEHQLSPDELQAAAQRNDAFAGVALNRHGNGTNADVCIADRVTGKITLRQLAIMAGSDSPRVLAVRAVDLLRESLRELPVDERPPPDVVGVTPAPAPRAIRAFTAKPARFRVGAAAAALGVTGGISTGYGAALSFWFRPVPRLAVGALLVGPLVGARYRSPNGDATLRQELVQARALFNLLEPGAVELGPVLGAGAYHVQAQGDVQAPFASQEAATWSFVGSGGIEARWELGASVSLGGSVQALLLTPQPVVAVANETQELAQPLLLAILGLGVSF